MAALPVLTSFEVLFPEEIVRDLFTPGTNFKQDLVGGAAATSGPIDMAGDRAQAQARPNETMLALQMCSIQLEKQNETVIKLFVTVYRSEGKDQIQQTDTTDTLLEVSVQTDERVVKDRRTQTDTRHLSDCVSQTDEMRLMQKFRNSSSLTVYNMSTQIDGSMMAVSELKSSMSQTEVKTTDSVVQTDRNVKITGSQTESSMAYMTDRELQTEIIQQEVDIQTDVSMALESDAEVQASATMVNQPTQTQVEVGNGQSQTDISMALQNDSESQCFVETSELSSQTELKVDDNGCQTNISMALQTQQETQASAEVIDSVSQTDISQALRGDQSTQKSTEVIDNFIQTDTSQSLQGEKETQTTETEEKTLMSSQESIGGSQDTAGDSVSGSQENQFTQIVDPESGKEYRNQTEAMKDGVAQTDPVTIIIGDASFLVRKLKSSAVSPSKVTTSGNEIEIELSADIATSDAPFETEEKENDVQGYVTPQTEAMVQRTGPMIRGGNPGVVTRQGTGGGVRVRMPTTVQSPVAMRMPAARIHPGPPVRFQSPTLTRTPVAPAAPTPRAPARTSSGGTFSCPFCSLIFIDSPALYEHLSVNHQVDQKTKWKQPKGREGKTIIPRKPRSPERGPPVLTPIEPLGTQTQTTQFTPTSHGTSAENPDDDDDEVAHEAGLFEDPVETSVVKKRRGRQAKGKSSDLDASIVSDDDIVPTSGKRKRKDFEGGNKQARVEGQWEELEDEEEEEETIPVKTSRRGGRTPRARTK